MASEHNIYNELTIDLLSLTGKITAVKRQIEEFQLKLIRLSVMTPLMRYRRWGNATQVAFHLALKDYQQALIDLNLLVENMQELEQQVLPDPPKPKKRRV